MRWLVVVGPWPPCALASVPATFSPAPPRRCARAAPRCGPPLPHLPSQFFRRTWSTRRKSMASAGTTTPAPTAPSSPPCAWGPRTPTVRRGGAGVARRGWGSWAGAPCRAHVPASGTTGRAPAPAPGGWSGCAPPSNPRSHAAPRRDQHPVLGVRDDLREQRRLDVRGAALAGCVRGRGRRVPGHRQERGGRRGGARRPRSPPASFHFTRAERAWWSG